ncbi:MAG: LacI family DNA-binding transcriptional regulator [Acidimicrobiales bacterium]
MKPKLQDIAAQTGLSIATVSRALRSEQDSLVSRDTRNLVREVAREIGYQPNLLGRSLKTGRTHTISYWTFDAFSAYYAQIAQQIGEQAAQRGYSVVIQNARDATHSLAAAGTYTENYEGNAVAAHFDGVIAACDVSFARRDFARVQRPPSTPWVGINVSYDCDLDHAFLDLHDGALQVMRHLLSGGLQRVAMMIRGGATLSYDPRVRAYRQMMDAGGLPQQHIEVVAHRRREARASMVAFVEESRALGRELPQAIFCVNDEVAIGAYRGLCDLDVRVPDEVRLVGCGGIEDTEYHACPISTVAMPIDEMCRTAWDYLENRLREPDLPLQQITLKPQLVVRASSQF